MKKIVTNIIRNIYVKLGNKLNSNPRFRFLVYSLYDKIRLVEFRIISFIQNDSLEQNDYVVYVNPQKIIYEKDLNENNWRLLLKFIKPLFNLRMNSIEIIDGDWDLEEELLYFNKDIKHISYYQHFVDGIDWKYTPYYKREKLLYLDGESRKEYKSVKDLDLKYKYLDNLFEKIKREGYKSQREVIESEGLITNYGRGNSVRKADDDITVAISRDGDVIFLDGRHRLNIAKILNFKKIPVRVLVVHPKFISKYKNNK